MSSLCILIINPFARYMICKYDLLFHPLPFKLFSLMQFHFAFLAVVAWWFFTFYQKNYCQDQCQGAFFICFFRCFMVSGLTFTSLIHFKIPIRKFYYIGVVILELLLHILEKTSVYIHDFRNKHFQHKRQYNIKANKPVTLILSRQCQYKSYIFSPLKIYTNLSLVVCHKKAFKNKSLQQ